MKKLFSTLSLFSVLALTSGLIHATPIIVDPVDGPNFTNWNDGWNRVGSLGAAYFSAERDGLEPTEGTQFWSIYRANPDAEADAAGVRKFFAGNPFQVGTYTMTFDMGRAVGWNWPNPSPAIHLVADIEGDGVYRFNNRITLNAI